MDETDPRMRAHLVVVRLMATLQPQGPPEKLDQWWADFRRMVEEYVATRPANDA